MDNQKTFEQQFMQNVKTAPQPVVPKPEGNPKPLQLIISIILGVVVVLQSIGLIILASNSAVSESSEEEYDDGETEEDTENLPYVYNDNNELVSMEATCTAENGSYLALTKDNSFEEYGIVSPTADSDSHVTKSTGEASPTLIDSGSYSVIRDSVFVFNKPSGNRTLYFDGFTLTDGSVFYECEEEQTEG